MLRLFGDKLRMLRQQHGLTQLVLAQHVGLAAHTHIGKIETGHDVPSLDLIIRIASVLGVSTDYLLRDTVPVMEAAIEAATVRSATMPVPFGKKLRVLRLEQAMSQTALARTLGLENRGYISNLEAGRKLPSIDLVLAIADLFGVTTDDLLASTVPPAASPPD
jgi:transcriptional regulator with XRE-family HTH domain